MGNLLRSLAGQFLWVGGVVLDPEREVAYWLGTPLIAALGFSVLRSFGGYADLRGAIEQVSLGTVEDGSEIFAVWLTVRNLGARPSSATHWRLHVRIADSTVTHDVVPVQFAGAGVAIALNGGPTTMMLPHTEFMHNKGANGITGGSYVAGVLVGEVPDGINPHDVLRAGSVVTATFKDIMGRDLDAKHIMTGVLGDSKWIPGIDAAIGTAGLRS